MANNWTEQQDIIALFLYTLLPSGKWDKDNPTIKEYAALINRTPDAVVFKLGNLRSLDNSHQSKGLANSSKMDRQVWNQYLNRPYELIAAYEESIRLFKPEDSCAAESRILLPFRQAGDDEPDYSERDFYGWVARRKGQKAFRFALLSNYRFQCCLSGVTTIQMLLASHIVPWSQDQTNRTNPQNGLLLNPLLDRAFDKGFITFSPLTYEAIITERIKDNALVEVLTQFKGKRIMLPNNPARWPKKEFLEYHNDTIFNSCEDILPFTTPALPY
ncbi:MAG: HNH endonuclease [Sphaerochaeta sp.]|nr:HNH endonuclease [Sphaerochaeta sp.]